MKQINNNYHYRYVKLKTKQKRFGLIAFATWTYQNTLIVRLDDKRYDKAVFTTSCVTFMILHNT